MRHDRYGTDIFPWERITQRSGPNLEHPPESTNDYAAFIVYRNLGPARLLRNVAQWRADEQDEELEPRHRQWVEIRSARYTWRLRAEAYDDYQQELKDATDAQAVIDMRKRHTQLSSAMQSKVAQALTQLSDRQLSRMTPEAMMRTLDLAMKNERIARGVPDSITALTNAEGGPVQVEVSDEELSRKLAAFHMSRGGQTDLERGEPAGPDTLEGQMEDLGVDLGPVVKGGGHAADWSDATEPLPESPDTPV